MNKLRAFALRDESYDIGDNFFKTTFISTVDIPIRLNFFQILQIMKQCNLVAGKINVYLILHQNFLSYLEKEERS